MAQFRFHLLRQYTWRYLSISMWSISNSAQTNSTMKFWAILHCSSLIPSTRWGSLIRIWHLHTVEWCSRSKLTKDYDTRYDGDLWYKGRQYGSDGHSPQTNFRLPLPRWYRFLLDSQFEYGLLELIFLFNSARQELVQVVTIQGLSHITDFCYDQHTTSTWIETHWRWMTSLIWVRDEDVVSSQDQFYTFSYAQERASSRHGSIPRATNLHSALRTLIDRNEECTL